MLSTTNTGKRETVLISQADERGHFGPYGGVFIAETLMEPVSELREAYKHYQHDSRF